MDRQFAVPKHKFKHVVACTMLITIEQIPLRRHVTGRSMEGGRGEGREGI